MELINTLVQTVGLDESFFYQFVFVGVLYFVTKKLFLNAYYKNVEKRRDLTQGRLISNKDLEDKIKNLQQEYEQQARKLNTKFQNVFNQIKEEQEEIMKQKKKDFQKAYETTLAERQESLLKEKQEQEKQIKEELPELIQALAGKVKG